MPILADFGTSFVKFIRLPGDRREIRPSREVIEGVRKGPGTIADVGTGHNAELLARRAVNELTALARGARRLLEPRGERSFVVLDVGSRDMKYVRWREGGVARLDWNTSCGALTGFSLELLGRHFGIDFASVAPASEPLPLACGLIGIERLFDLIAGGLSAAEAIARFTRGLALSAHRFAGRPDRLFLSGGMCDNPLFLASFPAGVEVIPLGRFVLAEGLLADDEAGAGASRGPPALGG